MDKKELKHDIVNERLIGIVEYLNENRIIAFQVVFALLAIISLSTWYTVSNKNYNKASIESLQKVLALDIEWVLDGHGVILEGTIAKQKLHRSFR